MVDQDKPASRQLEDIERDGPDFTQYLESERPSESYGVNPEDGMPQPISMSSIEDTKAPALTPETFICMADRSSFVIRDGEREIIISFPPEVIHRRADGSYFVNANSLDGEQANRCGLRRTLREGENWKISVEPLRPQCEHYRRQLLPFGKGHKSCHRYCTAMKNEAGELIDLANSEVFACEMREPRDPASEQQLDDFDDGIVARGSEAAQTDEEFDVDTALDQMNLGVLGKA